MDEIDEGGRLPDFLVIGATKAGATSLCAYLRDHPQVFLHPRREMRFFSDAAAWARGPDWYASQFAGAGAARAVGEASSAYSRHPVYADVPERAASVVPDARLIYLVREPFARLESHYRWRRSTGHEWRPPQEAFLADRSYVAASLYGLQLAEWLRVFPSDRLLVLSAERLSTDPKAVLGRVCRHLDVEFDPRRPFRAERAAHRRRMADAPRQGPRGPASRPLGRTTGLGGYDLPDGLRDEIAALFEEDRRLLTEIAGPEVARWPGPWEAPRPPRRFRRVPGFAETPAGWLAARLGLAPSTGPSSE